MSATASRATQGWQGHASHARRVPTRPPVDRRGVLCVAPTPTATTKAAQRVHVIWAMEHQLQENVRFVVLASSKRFAATTPVECAWPVNISHMLESTPNAMTAISARTRQRPESTQRAIIAKSANSRPHTASTPPATTVRPENIR